MFPVIENVSNNTKPWRRMLCLLRNLSFIIKTYLEKFPLKKLWDCEREKKSEFLFI
jgi:hypothetical protein